jgi:hypothetical protein
MFFLVFWGELAIAPASPLVAVDVFLRKRNL